MFRIQKVTLRPIRMLTQMYNQTLLMAPKTQVRRMSDVEEEWPKLETDLLRSIGRDDPNCEHCENRVREWSAPPVSDEAKRTEAEKAGWESESDKADFLDTWRDPLTIRIQLANPPEEADEKTGDSGHNISML